MMNQKTRRLLNMVKKITCILLVVLLFLFAGCQGDTADSDTAKEGVSEATRQPAPSGTASADSSSAEDSRFNPGGVFPICKETVPLAIAIAENSLVEDFETNKQTLLLEERGNFDLSFDIYPSADFSTKLNLMVSSGGDDLPDVILHNPGDAKVLSFAKAGAIIPLTEYYKDPDAAFFINDAIRRTETDFLKMITSPDGELYGIPAYNQSLTNETGNKLWIYKPWLDTLGLQAPETPEDLYEVFKAFRDNDPNGNGLKDEVPLTGYTGWYGWFQALMNPYIYAGDGNYFVVENGNVSAAYNTEEWREGLRYIKKLFDEELISPLTLTQDNAQYKAMLQGDETIVGFFVGSPSILSATDERRLDYIGIPPLKGSNGTQYAIYSPQVPYIAFMISKNCKDPEAAFRLGDLMVSEELSIHTRWGEKGVDWVEAGPNDKTIYEELGLGYPAVLKVIKDQWSDIQNAHWRQAGPFVRQYSIALGVVSETNNPLETMARIATIQGEYTDKIPKERIEKLIYTEEESNLVTEPMTNLRTYVNESMAMFVTGAKDLDSDWDAYLKELDTIGLETVLKTVQTVYDRMYK